MLFIKQGPMNNLILKDWNDESESTKGFEVKSPADLQETVNYWMHGKPKSRIFVCYDTWKTPAGDQRVHFMITKVHERVNQYVSECVSNLISFPGYQIDFNIREFVIWEEAFYFCADLQEEL